jgi:hypothetical protein
MTEAPPNSVAEPQVESPVSDEQQRLDTEKAVADIIAEPTSDATDGDDGASGLAEAGSGDEAEASAAPSSPDAEDVADLPGEDKLAAAIMDDVADLPGTEPAPATPTATEAKPKAAAPSATANTTPASIPDNFETTLGATLDEAVNVYGKDEPEGKALLAVKDAVTQLAAINRAQAKELAELAEVKRDHAQARQVLSQGYEKQVRASIDALGPEFTRYFGDSSKGPVTEKAQAQAKKLEAEAVRIQKKAEAIKEPLSADDAIRIAAHKLTGKMTTPDAVKAVIGQMKTRTAQRTPAGNGRPASAPARTTVKSTGDPQQDERLKLLASVKRIINSKD